MSSFFEKHFRSEETYNLLNLITLKIYDDEIAREYELYLIKRFGWLRKLVSYFLSALVLSRWMSYFLGSINIQDALRSSHLLLSIATL